MQCDQQGQGRRRKGGSGHLGPCLGHKTPAAAHPQDWGPSILLEMAGGGGGGGAQPPADTAPCLQGREGREGRKSQDSGGQHPGRAKTHPKIAGLFLGGAGLLATTAHRSTMSAVGSHPSQPRPPAAPQDPLHQLSTPPERHLRWGHPSCGGPCTHPYSSCDQHSLAPP